MIRMIDENFDLHARMIIEQTKGMHVFSHPDLMYTDSGLGCDHFNIIHVREGKGLRVGALNSAINHFQDRHLPHCIWISQENWKLSQVVFEEMNLYKQAEGVGMILNLSDYQMIHDPHHTSINKVNSLDEIGDYAEVIAANWTPPARNVTKFYQITAPQFLTLTDRITRAVYSHENQPLATIELFPTDDQVVGIYGLATKRPFRKQGIGSAMMSYALNIAKESGFKYVVLQASPDGLGIYKKYGFKEKTIFYEFI